MKQTNLSANQMALLCCLGILLADSTFVVLAVFHRTQGNLLRVLAGLTLFATGGWLILGTTSRLSNGIAADRWPQQQIVGLRNNLQSSWWNAVSIVLLFVYASTLLISSRREWHAIGFMCFVTIMESANSAAQSSSQLPPPPRRALNGATRLAFSLSTGAKIQATSLDIMMPPAQAS